MGMRQQEREHAFTRVQRRYTTRDGRRPSEYDPRPTRMHYLASVDTYIYGYETAREREDVYDQRRWRGHEWGAGERDERAEARGEAPERERQTTGAEECETEYEPVAAGLRDGDELPTFSVRQQEWGGKANLDGPFLPTARDDHSRTGWAGTTTTDMRERERDGCSSPGCCSLTSDTPH